MVKLSNTACWVSFILLDVQLINSSSDLRAPRSTIVTEGVISKGSDEWEIYGGTGVFARARGVIKRKNPC
jgi:hypothetical protein